jgi:predicted dehydrogenase
MLRIAIFGLGRVSEDIHLPACRMLSDARIVAACEPVAARREKQGRRFNIAALYEKPETLLKQEKPDIVIIATPPDSHADLCLQALDYGAHVFCEKPFVRSTAEADEVIEAAEQRQLSVFVNNQYRFMKIYRDVKKKISSGEYGEPFLIQCWQQMFHPPTKEQNWRARLVQSTLYEFGTHPLDLMCFMFDSYPLSITAHTPQPDPDIKADVVVQATLRFPGERLATLMLNRISHARERYLEMRIDCEKASVRISFGGVARISAEWSSSRGLPLTRLSFVKGGEARVEAEGRAQVLSREWTEARARATALHLQSLVDAVKQAKAVTKSARHSRELIRIVSGGYESAQKGETVWLENSSHENYQAQSVSDSSLP